MLRPVELASRKSEIEHAFYRLNTDGGIVAMRGQPSGEAAIGAVLKTPRMALSCARFRIGSDGQKTIALSSFERCVTRRRRPS